MDFFVAGSKLQMIRMDGQDLQTLYCSSAPATEISGVQWSPDQQQVIFFGGGKPQGEQTLYLLDIARGTVQPELFYTGPSTFYIPRTWIDSKRVYLVGVPRLSSGPEPTPVRCRNCIYSTLAMVRTSIRKTSSSLPRRNHLTAGILTAATIPGNSLSITASSSSHLARLE